jgi:hypothetical protein
MSLWNRDRVVLGYTRGDMRRFLAVAVMYIPAKTFQAMISCGTGDLPF